MSDAREELHRIRERVNATVEGPWEAREESPTMSGTVWNLRRAYTPGILMSFTEYRHGMVNAEFIASSRTDIPALLDVAEAVLARHRKSDHTRLIGFPRATGEEYYCMEDQKPYPCPTVTDIENIMRMKND